jgi:hypothetical protein
MPSSRDFLNESAEHDHALVPVITELRDSLGALAVQVLAARENLATLSYEEMLQKLHPIIEELHRAYDRTRTILG